MHNHVWESGCFCFPPSWQEAVVIPISKPDKDHLEDGNFRLIALTSCLCKTMKNNYGQRSPQVVPRVARSPFGEAVRFQEEPQYIRSYRSFQNVYQKCLCQQKTKQRRKKKSEHVLTIFFDPEKPYDSNTEARHSGGPLGSRFEGPPPQVYSELPIRTFLQG